MGYIKKFVPLFIISINDPTKKLKKYQLSSPFNHTLLDDELIDLKLRLEDDNQEIVMDVHRQILHSMCPFFEKLLTRFREKDFSEIAITVPYADVTYDIIMQYYGYPSNYNNLAEDEHFLKMIMCKNYLGLPIYVPEEIRIETERFDFLLYITMNLFQMLTFICSKGRKKSVQHEL